MRQLRHSSFCILHCAFCIALVALCASSARADWLYDTSAKTLTEQDVPSGDTAWVFNCSVSGQNLTLSSVKTAGTATALDFRAAITASNGGAFAITALGNNLFLSNAYITSLATSH